MKGPLSSSFLSCEETSDGRGADAGDTTVLPCSSPYNSKLHNSAEATVLNFLSKKTSHNPTTPTLLTRPRWKEDRNHTLASFLTKFRGRGRDQRVESNAAKANTWQAAEDRGQGGREPGWRRSGTQRCQRSAAGAKAARRTPHLPGRGDDSGAGSDTRPIARPAPRGRSRRPCRAASVRGRGWLRPPAAAPPARQAPGRRPGLTDG